MYFHIFAIALALLPGAAGHGRAHHRTGHHSVVRAHHQARKHHAGKRHTASYASARHSLDKMVEKTTQAQEELKDASRELEEAILDIELDASNMTGSSNATMPALRGATKTLPHNLSATLSTQQANLEKLLSHLKGNIAGFNKREADQKKDSERYAERLKKRLEQDKKKLEDPKLSDFDREMLVNRTRTEEHEMKFWMQGRSLQHDMFHSNLKLTHGLMSKVKTVMDAYKQMLTTGKVDPKLAQVLHETSASMPKALIQKEQRVQRDVKKLDKHLLISAKLLHKA